MPDPVTRLPVPAGAIDRTWSWLHHPMLRPLAALALLLLVDLMLIPGFFRLEIKDGHLYGSLVDIVNRAAPLMLAALGMTLVIATRGIDISVGAVVALAGTVAAVLIGGTMVVQHGVPAYVSRIPMGWALAAAVGAAVLCGAWNGVLVAGLKLQPIVATLILMVAGRGLAQLLTDGQIVTVYYQPFFYLGSGYLFGLPFALYAVAVVAGGTALLVKKTALGLFIQAVGINPVAARLAGVRTATLIFSVYVFCSACAGVAGLMIASNIKSADANNAGLLLELDAILAVTLGGTQLAGGKFSLAGSLVGALIIQTLTYTIYSLGVPPEVNMVVKSVVVFIVCLAQSERVRGALRMMRTLRAWPASPYFTSLVTVALLLALLLAGGAAYPGFLSEQVLFNLLIDNAFLLVIAVGMSFVILSGGIDLSVGSVLALSTMIAAWLLQTAHWPAWAVIVTVLVLGAAFGAAMGALIHYFRLQAFIVTLAGMFLARGLCYLISIASITIDNPVFVAISRTQLALPGGFISTGALIALIVLAIGIWLAHATAFGRAVYAVGGNEQSALMMGLPVGRTKVLVYALSGFCAALAGVLFAFYMLSGYGLHAQGTELDAIAAVVIGGTLLAGGYGYIAGALSGVLVLGAIQTLIAFDGTLSSWWTKIVIGALLFVFCVVQRALGKREK